MLYIIALRCYKYVAVLPQRFCSGQPNLIHEPDIEIKITPAQGC